MTEQQRNGGPDGEEPNAQEFMSYEEFETYSQLMRTRSELANRAGMHFGGDRDVYDAVGYPETVNYKDSKERFTRQDIAAAIVESYPDSTWKEAPKVKADSEEFEKEVKRLFEKSRMIQLDRSVLHYFKRTDILARLGEYSVLFIGWADAKDKDDLKNEVQADQIDNIRDIMYLTPVPEPNVDFNDKVTDPSSPRFGKPATYEIDFDELHTTTTVHWSRVIHVAEGVLEDPLQGRPVLERVMNRLYDIEKILASSGEGAWLAANPGLQLDIDKDLHGQVDTEDLETQIEEYEHDMRRFIKSWGTDIKEIQTETIDPKNSVDTQISLLAGAMQIPKRKLLGSERGDLASSQDEASWFEKVSGRQSSFAEPVILRPFLDRLIKYEALPQVQEYTVEWSELFQLTQLERANLGLQKAQTARTAAPGGDPATVLTPEEVREELLGWEPEMETELPEEPDVDGTGAGTGPGGPQESPTIGQVDEEHFDDITFGAKQYSEGDVVEAGGKRGVVVDIYEGNVVVDGETTEGSGDSPVYIIAHEDGSAAFKASEIEKSDWNEDIPDEVSDPEKAKEAETANIYEDAKQTNIRLQNVEFAGFIAGRNPGLGWDSWPPTWEKSPKPARLILLDAWSSMGGTFRGCRTEIHGPRADAFCASMKDEVLLTEDWRGGFDE
jgi:hypothetical protein